MQTIHILAIVSTVLFVAYNIIVNVINGKILPSLSDSFYLLNEKKNGLGYAFSVMLFIVVITLIPTAIDITPDVWKFIPFIMCGSLALVGSAPLFKAQDNPWHSVFAILSAAASIGWAIALQAWICFAVGISLAGLGWVLSHFLLKQEWKSVKTYWLEMMCFYSVYITVMVRIIMSY